MAWPTAFLGISALIRVPMLWLSRRLGGFCELEHVGRRSGRTFSTPVRAVRRGGIRGERVIIGASFGVTSDWIRNTMAAGGCRILIHGELLELTAPRIVAYDEVAGDLPPVMRFILHRLARTDRCVVLQVR